MSAIQYLLAILVIIVSVIIVILVALQESKQQGLSGAIGGAAETFFGKNKAKSMEGKLALATKVSAGVFIVCALLIAVIG